MSRRAANLRGLLIIAGSLCSFLLPQLTGKTMLTKLQIAVIVIGAVGVVAQTWRAFIDESTAQAKETEDAASASVMLVAPAIQHVQPAPVAQPGPSVQEPVQ